MNKIIKRLFTPLAVFAMAIGIGVSVNAQKDVVGARAATTVSVGNDFTAVSGNFDANFRYDSFKGGGTTAPALNGGDIRLYQKSGGGDGGYITVSPRTADYKMTSFTISASMAGPFSVYSISAGSVDTPDPSGWTSAATSPTWVGTALPKTYTYNNPSGFTHFKVLCNGTSSSTRIYVDSISITYDYFGGAAVPVSGISIDDNIESLSLMEGTSQQLTATIAPSDATNKNVSWSSSDETKVTVVNGLVNALAVTSTPVTVTVTTADGGKTDSVEVTVTADPFTVVKTSTFGSSGSPDYPTVTGMGTYFTTGYGTTDKNIVGSLKSTNLLLADVPVGSDIKVEIAAVVNNASDTKIATVYGLDYAGDRISGIMGTYTVPAGGGATGSLPNLTTFAQENKGLVVLSGSILKKAYGIEVEFGTSAARAVLVEISVYYSSDETDENQAIAFANLVNNDVGLGANGSCSSILEVLQNDYSLLSSGAKTIFDTSSDNDFVSARERLSYLESWVAQNPSATPTREAVNNSSNRNLAVVSIGLIGLTSILGYYFINKKRSLG